MNLKHRLSPNLILVSLGLIIICIMFIFISPRNQEEVKLAEVKFKSLRQLTYEELSPDTLNNIISYNFTFNTSVYGDYYKDYFNNDIVISVQDMEDDTENYVFTGSRIGEPKWLGNEHVFFTSYCGSSCQGIYLVNVFNKETKQGVLSYMFSEQNKTSYIVFKDWFGHTFKFKGLVDEIKSDTIGDKIYLIFYMRDDEQKSIGQKRFLFTGKILEE